MDIYLLDMGAEKYGDCIVCVGGGKTVIIDGGHSGDIRARGDTPSLPDQLAAILGPYPFSPDLLIVTHCHADHIGCLPAMVANGMLTPKAALVADPDLGFGSDGGAGAGDDADPVADPVADRLAAALREEAHDDIRSDQALAAFIQDAATLESRYRAMLKSLADAGTRVVAYAKPEDGTGFEPELRALGLRVLGPTAEHLQVCAEAIKGFVANAKTRVRRAQASEGGASDAGASEVELYRALSRDPSMQDMVGKGAALNDQSIVVMVEEGGQPALLTGDMQFAKPEQPGVDDAMRALRQTVIDAGPYAMVKLAHHGSYNGSDQSTLDAFGARVLTISGGRNDPDHPDPGTLRLLAAQTGVTWARTDRNGRIQCRLNGDGAALTIGRGEFNDATPNVAGDAAAVAAPVALVRPAAADPGTIEVTARLPNASTRVTITIDVRPGDLSPGEAAGPAAAAAPGSAPARSSPAVRKATRDAVSIAAPAPYAMRATGRKLLFVTRTAKLVENIGAQEAQLALSAIQAAGHALLDVATPDAPYPEVRRASASPGLDGVVVLGGFDVLPSARMDVLDPDLRRQVGADASNDGDNFVVWSDQLYGDTNGDEFAELPVSRIPDGHSASLVKAALTSSVGGAGAFGLRNVHRPFAASVFAAVPGAAGEPITSVPRLAADFRPGDVAGSAYYLMLHGSYADGARFWGEDDGGNSTEAFNADLVPAGGGVVFAGCCWGALTVRKRASQYTPGEAVQVMTCEQSVALSFLKAGANAFVGCTGSHYSPINPATPTYFGGPMHQAFWQAIGAGHPPALALFEAKKQYAKDIPHGRATPVEVAIEAKTLRQFTCLGLGW